MDRFLFPLFENRGRVLSDRHRPRKRFGQHFLCDESIVDRIVAVIMPRHDQRFIEIGPGLGALTKKILPLIASLDAIELDRDIIPKLIASCQSLGKLTVHEGDVLNFDFSSLCRKEEKFRVIGNLPYNISSPLIFHLLEYANCIEDMHFMLQKEVVDRLVAKKGTKQYGRLTVMVQYLCQAEYLFSVPSNVFSPRPKVDSAMVRLMPRLNPSPRIKNRHIFEEVVKQSFSLRRKTLRNALKGKAPPSFFEELGIDGNMRPEQLTVKEFVEISNRLSD